jgi:hypothetical protein
MKIGGVFLVFSLGVALAQAPEYKNLQILKGIPPARIPMVMNTFNRVLGVECTHCHVADAMEKEDKPQFGTTRKMFQMRNAVAQQYKVNIACWTCHHGNSKPTPPIKDVWPEELKLTPEQEKLPTQQVFKNIKFFTDNAGSMRAGMNFLSASLGVGCDHCHVVGAWEKDDKPAKDTARKMLAMVRDMRRDFAPWRFSCTTCHRGSVKPEVNPPPA